MSVWQTPHVSQGPQPFGVLLSNKWAVLDPGAALCCLFGCQKRRLILTSHVILPASGLMLPTFRCPALKPFLKRPALTSCGLVAIGRRIARIDCACKGEKVPTTPVKPGLELGQALHVCALKTNHMKPCPCCFAHQSQELSC